MKLLLDGSLPPRQVRQLGDSYPECVRVHTLGMDRTSEVKIWASAREHDYTIVSEVADSHQRSLALGSPPKALWRRMRNCSVAETTAVLRERDIVVRRFIEETEATFLALS